MTDQQAIQKLASEKKAAIELLAHYIAAHDQGDTTLPQARKQARSMIEARAKSQAGPITKAAMKEWLPRWAAEAKSQTERR